MKILLIDDEPIILNSIKAMVEQIKPEWQIDTCLNAIVGQDYLLNNNYDILLTDINLPILNGLDLVKWCRNSNIDVNIAIISAYSEFDYAQTSMSYDVKYYILKPIEKEAFKDILNKLEKECVKKQTYLLKKTLNSLIIQIPAKAPNESQNIITTGSQNSILNNYVFLPLIICKGVLSKSSWISHSSQKSNVQNQDKRHLEDYLNIYLKEDETAWLYNSPFKSLFVIITIPKEHVQDRPNKILKYLESWLIKQISMTMIAGPIIKEAKDIVRTQMKLLDLMPQCIVLGKSLFYNIDNYNSAVNTKVTHEIKAKLKVLYQEFWEKLINYSEVKYDDWYNTVNVWSHNNLSQAECEEEIYNFVTVGNLNFKNYELKNFLPNSITNGILQIFENSNNWESFRERTILLFDRIHQNIFNHSKDDINTSKRLLAREMKEYIENNYQNKLSNDDLANTFSYSIAHLTNIFKEYYNCTPLDYLFKFRIKIAKRLLKSRPDMNISEIGFACGFLDPGYFSKVFKKSTGHSPDLYRKEM